MKVYLMLVNGVMHLRNAADEYDDACRRSLGIITDGRHLNEGAYLGVREAIRVTLPVGVTCNLLREKFGGISKYLYLVASKYDRFELKDSNTILIHDAVVLKARVISWR